MNKAAIAYSQYVIIKVKLNQFFQETQMKNHELTTIEQIISDIDYQVSNHYPDLHDELHPKSEGWVTINNNLKEAYRINQCLNAWQYLAWVELRKYATSIDEQGFRTYTGAGALLTAGLGLAVLPVSLGILSGAIVGAGLYKKFAKNRDVKNQNVITRQAILADIWPNSRLGTNQDIANLSFGEKQLLAMYATHSEKQLNNIKIYKNLNTVLNRDMLADFENKWLNVTPGK
jgi:hypothetical protein